MDNTAHCAEPVLRADLDQLMAEVEHAYRRARRIVYDRLPEGTTVQTARLNLLQRLALAHLERAEHELRAFRWREAHRDGDLTGSRRRTG